MNLKNISKEPRQYRFLFCFINPLVLIIVDKQVKQLLDRSSPLLRVIFLNVTEDPFFCVVDLAPYVSTVIKSPLSPLKQTNKQKISLGNILSLSRVIFL